MLVRKGGTTVSGGADISLDFGANVITITVTAEDGSTGNYPITITREPDTEVPTVQISGPSGVLTAAFAVQFEWSETVSGFTAGDIEVTNGSISSFTRDPNDERVWTASVTPRSNTQGTLTVSVPAGAVTDGSNQNPPASQTFTIDLLAPTVTFSSTSLTDVSGAFEVTITFSEDVTGFTAGDIDVTNSTKSQFTTTDDANYTIRITPTDRRPSHRPRCPPAPPPTPPDTTTPASTTLTRTADVTAPTVTLTSTSSANVSGAFDVTIRFSEAVNGFTTGDIEVANATTSDFSGSRAAYTVKVTPTADGAVTVKVPADAATDTAGHNNTSLHHPHPHRRRHRPHRHPHLHLLGERQRRLRGSHRVQRRRHRLHHRRHRSHQQHQKRLHHNRRQPTTPSA